MLVFASIRFFDNSENFASAIHMFNSDANLCQLSIVLFLLFGEFAMFGLFDGGEAVRIQLKDALIARIGVLFQFFLDPKLTLFQQLEVMCPAFPTHDHKYLKCFQTDDHLRFDGMAFFCPNSTHADA